MLLFKGTTSWKVKKPLHWILLQQNYNCFHQDHRQCIFDEMLGNKILIFTMSSKVANIKYPYKHSINEVMSLHKERCLQAIELWYCW